MGAYFKDNNGVTRKIAFYEKGAKPEETKTVTPDFASGNVAVTPTSGKVLSQVTVVKDNDLVPENIVKDVNIFGVVGTAETGGGTSGGYTVTFNCYGGMSIGLVRIIQANGSDFVVSVGYSNQVTSIFENVTYIKEAYESASPATYTGITAAEYKAGKTLTNDIVLAIYD